MSPKIYMYTKSKKKKYRCDTHKCVVLGGTSQIHETRVRLSDLSGLSNPSNRTLGDDTFSTKQQSQHLLQQTSHFNHNNNCTDNSTSNYTTTTLTIVSTTSSTISTTTTNDSSTNTPTTTSTITTVRIISVLSTRSTITTILSHLQLIHPRAYNVTTPIPHIHYRPPDTHRLSVV
mgnify:CR=1 FL=1